MAQMTAKERADAIVFRPRWDSRLLGFSHVLSSFTGVLAEEAARADIKDAIEAAEQAVYRSIAEEAIKLAADTTIPGAYLLLQLIKKCNFLGGVPQSERDDKRESELATFMYRITGDWDPGLARAALALENGHDVKLVGQKAPAYDFWGKT